MVREAPFIFKMSKLQLFQALLTERLTFVANEIFAAVEITISEYQEEVERTKEENTRLQRLLDLFIKPEIKLHRADAHQTHGSQQQIYQQQISQQQISQQQISQQQISQQQISQQQISQQQISQQQISQQQISQQQISQQQISQQETSMMVERVKEEQEEISTTPEHGESCSGPEPSNDPSACSGNASDDPSDSNHLELQYADVDESAQSEYLCPSESNTADMIASAGPESQGTISRVCVKKNYCLFCSRPYSKIARHLEYIHRNELEVAKAITFPKNSRERKAQLDRLRKRGNFSHNADVSRKGSGHLIAVYKPRSSREADDFTHCEYCQGLYLKKTLWKHVKTCQLKVNDEFQGHEGSASRATMRGKWDQSNGETHD